MSAKENIHKCPRQDERDELPFRGTPLKDISTNICKPIFLKDADPIISKSLVQKPLSTVLLPKNTNQKSQSKPVVDFCLQPTANVRRSNQNQNIAVRKGNVTVPCVTHEETVRDFGKVIRDKWQDSDLMRARCESSQNELSLCGVNDGLCSTSERFGSEASLFPVDPVEESGENGLETSHFGSQESDSDFSDDDFVKKKKRRRLSVESEPADVNDPKLPQSTRKTPNCRKKESDRQAAINAAKEKSKSLSKISHILPQSFDYVILTLDENQENPNAWKALIRVNLNTKKEAEDWLNEFQELSHCDYRIRDSKKENSPKILFKKMYRCHQNIPQGKKSDISHIQTEKSYIAGKKSKPRVSKHTGCPSNMTITIKQTGMEWSSDDLLQKYPCVILIHFNHNHFILVPKSLKRRRPTKAIEEKFRELFKKGHSPSTAHEMHKFDLQTEFSDERYVIVSADRSKNPDVKWAFRLYYKIYQKHYGASHGEGMVAAMENFIEKYNESQGSICVASKVLNEKDLVVAVCTPMMKRVHEKLKSAGEMMFVDSSGTMDALNATVFLLLCPSIAGGLPLGILLVSSEAEVVLKSALDLWMTLLPSNGKAFGGRGEKGPKIIMTDDCTHERNALNACFPEARLLLCLFHVLQAFWSYVWKADHKVVKNDRGTVYFHFRDVVYASEAELFESLYEEMLNLPAVSSNSILTKHLTDFKPRAKEWALHMRSDLLTRGHNTNNYSEAGMCVLKDKVCQRVKAFSPVQLLDFILTRFMSYLERRIVDVINGRQENVQRSRYFISPDKLKPLKASSLPSPHLYKVKNEAKGTEYVVNMLDELCTCPVGCNGSPCKHQCAVALQFKLPSTQIINAAEVDPQIKKDLLYIVYGASAKLPPNWFSDSQITDSDNCADGETNSNNVESGDVAEDLGSYNVDATDSRPIYTAKSNFSSEEINKLEQDLRAMVDGWVSSLQ